MLFADTSAFFAALIEEDEAHGRAVEVLRGRPELVTHNYVVVETAALLAVRVGPATARDFLEGLLGPVRVLFVDQEIHQAAVRAYLGSLRRRPSLVDLVSFEVMRREGIETAFAFDRDFGQQGFRTVP